MNPGMGSKVPCQPCHKAPPSLDSPLLVNYEWVVVPQAIVPVTKAFPFPLIRCYCCELHEWAAVPCQTSQSLLPTDCRHCCNYIGQQFPRIVTCHKAS
ncbi:hypothetical protein AVEN_242507-1 [Araneus ventricosus]|uniref:Uncharacterized protein n=1 Tax=Araneus ventricosus TaxID=182803 RepID=A0A4Y2VBT9_ARAVE|nr:hypothetical protein AVEN_242507-1 [Araneus ventricosus]